MALATEPVDVVSAPPEQRIALEVLRLALIDFGVLKTTTKGQPTTTRGVGRSTPDERVVIAVDAGTFLLERNDEIAALWFNMAGYETSAFRAHVRERRPEWFARLRELRRRMQRRMERVGGCYQ